MNFFENDEPTEALPSLTMDADMIVPPLEEAASYDVISDAEGEDDATSVPAPPLPTHPPLEEESVAGKPFVIELLRLDVQPSGNFRPDSAVCVSRSLRTSGLLHALPPEELKTLLWMLTFTTANGNCAPNLLQLAQAMQVPESKASARLERLLQTRWQGQPLIFAVPQESGAISYAPSPHIVAFIERPPTLVYAPKALAPVLAGRDAVIAYSRAHYARPRAEVEAEIQRRLGHEEEVAPTDPAELAVWKVKQTLRALGMTREQCDLLFARYPLERIENQLAWLPYRSAKNPLAFLLSAIEGDYEMPLALRQQAISSPPPQP